MWKVVVGRAALFDSPGTTLPHVGTLAPTSYSVGYTKTADKQS